MNKAQMNEEFDKYIDDLKKHIDDLGSRTFFRGEHIKIILDRLCEKHKKLVDIEMESV